MAPDPDLAVDRLRLKRRLLVWRVTAVAAFVVALVAAGSHSLFPAGGVVQRDHLVRLRITGVIGADNRKQLELIDQATTGTSVRGMILVVDSPGGSVSGGEALHDAIARFAARKPVVVSMGGVAASAGYMISVPGRRLFAAQSTLTGSIGVIMEAPDVSGLLDHLGVKVDQLVSGPMKGQPSVVQPLSSDGRQMLQGVVADLFDQFVTMVAQGRHLPVERVRALADGRPYTGRQALALGLVDQIGTEADAKAWLIQTQHLSEAIPVTDLRVRSARPWLRRAIGGILGLILDDEWTGSVLSQGVALDGAVAIWKP
ncbi:signal peptide peptidase sppA [Gluconacetobacter johannae DSM 13595]|uniref:Signal peptide peptidase SppA n=1 Tax=Gluconacetobacter johannae TaxID=112140 RepID=A0A7W4J9B3_9PROT|nr:signal peptide peptidase SppA [Gluconacetobacter johannae]MBB2176959.1 signal peptide peptidase SppA [Gluconacetobacter johannae]GBQ89695.1 signal peptide peptidase sppA [Gluconacetobacter johannae DSM 13595]